MDDAAIIEVLREDGPLSTVEIAERLGSSPRAADHRLRELHDAGSVEAAPIGNAIIWSISEGENGSEPGVVGNTPADPD